MSSNAHMKSEEARPARRPRRRSRLAWLLLALAVVLLLFWELRAVVAALNHLDQALARGEAARQLAAGVGRLVLAQFRALVANLGHWLIRLAGR